MSFSVVLQSTKSITNNDTTGGVFTGASLASNVLTAPTTTLQNLVNIINLKAQTYQLSYGGSTATFTGVAPSPYNTPTNSSGKTSGTVLTLNNNYSPTASTLIVSGIGITPTTITGFPAITNLNAEQL